MGARAGGLSLGSWTSGGTGVDWRLVCMGTLEVHDDRLLFLGQTATEQISFADIIGTGRGPAVNQWGAVLPEFSRLIIHRAGRTPIALSCTHTFADALERIRQESAGQGSAVAPLPRSHLPEHDGNKDALVASGNAVIFEGVLIACFDNDGVGGRPLGCASYVSFSPRGIALGFVGHAEIFLSWNDVTTVAYSGDRYDDIVGGGEEPQFAELLRAGIAQSRARVLVADEANEWLLDTSWLPRHKDLLNHIDDAWHLHSDLEPWGW